VARGLALEWQLGNLVLHVRALTEL
jgi:hypothetical protein